MGVDEELSLHVGVCNNHVGVDTMGHWQSHVEVSQTYQPFLDDVLSPDLTDLVVGYLLQDYCVELAEASRGISTFNDFFDKERHVLADEALEEVLVLYNLRTENYPMYVKKMVPMPIGVEMREYCPLVMYMLCQEFPRFFYRPGGCWTDGGYTGFNTMMLAVVGHIQRHYPSRQAVLNLWMDHFQGVLENELSPPYYTIHPHFGRMYVLQQVRVPWYLAQ
jgi:hypothetical protein